MGKDLTRRAQKTAKDEGTENSERVEIEEGSFVAKGAPLDDGQRRFGW